MGQVIINGKVYTIFEMAPVIVDNKYGLIKEEMEKKEKHMREQDWKRRARYNYRKK